MRGELTLAYGFVVFVPSEVTFLTSDRTLTAGK